MTKSTSVPLNPIFRMFLSSSKLDLFAHHFRISLSILVSTAQFKRNLEIPTRVDSLITGRTEAFPPARLKKLNRSEGIGIKETPKARRRARLSSSERFSLLSFRLSCSVPLNSAPWTGACQPLSTQDFYREETRREYRLTPVYLLGNFYPFPRTTSGPLDRDR